jgi:predicted phosphoribosyltransferase
MKRFHDRADAGRRLAERLTEFAGHPEVLVLALPRGGVPVAAEVARQLRAPLDILVVRKLGLPGNEEYAMGAIASGGAQVLNPQAIERYGLRAADVAAVVRRETAELRRRESAYRGGCGRGEREARPGHRGDAGPRVDDRRRIGGGGGRSRVCPPTGRLQQRRGVV